MEYMVQAVDQLDLNLCCITAKYSTPIPDIKRLRSVSEGEDSKESRQEVTVCGAEHGDIPFTYVVKDLGTAELPVIGEFTLYFICKVLDSF